MKWFLVDYEFNGDTYTIDLEAEDWQDAEARLYAIFVTARVEGELIFRGAIEDE